MAPLGDFQRYDLVIDDEGKFLRVQCKTGRLIARRDRVPSVQYRFAKQARRMYPKGLYGSEIDLFGVYCPENHTCYLVPVADVAEPFAHLRIEPPRNGQQTRIRWAGDYEINKEVELRGFEPLTF